MHQVNPQKPFSYQEKGHRYKVVPTANRTEFSRNIKGICPICKALHQRIKKFDGEGKPLEPQKCLVCMKERGYDVDLIEIPKELRPWKLYTAKECNPYYFGKRFGCTKCSKTYADFFTFGAYCDHSSHIPPNGYVCRFCCTKQVENPIAITKKSAKLTKKEVLESLYRDAEPGHVLGEVNLEQAAIGRNIIEPIQFVPVPLQVDNFAFNAPAEQADRFRLRARNNANGQIIWEQIDADGNIIRRERQ